jgi:8-oxo-dGTP diphosphatase
MCEIISGNITLHEHRAMVWLPIEKLHTLDWAEADLPIIREYQEEFIKNRKES